MTGDEGAAISGNGKGHGGTPQGDPERDFLDKLMRINGEMQKAAARSIEAETKIGKHIGQYVRVSRVTACINGAMLVLLAVYIAIRIADLF